MPYFKLSLLSIVVCSSIASAAGTAATHDNYFNANSAVKNTQAQFSQGLNKVSLAKQVTVAGMKSHFDDTLNRATFIWASKNQHVPSLQHLAPEKRTQAAADYYLSSLTGVTTNRSLKNKAVLSNMHKQGGGAVIAKYKQEVYGIEVFNREFNIMINQEHQLVAASGYLSERRAVDAAVAINNFGSPQQAISHAFTAMGGEEKNVRIFAVGAEENKYQKFDSATIGEGYKIINQPRAKKVMYELNGKLVAAHYVEIEAGKSDEMSSNYFAFVIAADTGRVLYKKNLVNSEKSFSYRVFADSTLNNVPHDGPLGDVSPWPAAKVNDLTTKIIDAELISLIAGPISTNDPWLADDAVITSGNNVNAYVDAIAPQGFTNGDYHAETTSANTFDHPLNTEQNHYSVDNRKAAITNLFYVNNYLHDQFYDHGFDEKSGNAQKSNYERGGEEGDAINAEAQDNSGLNNANMSTPADGASPRMQMYLYDDFKADVGEDYGVYIVGSPDVLLESSKLSNFGARRFSAPIVGEVVRFIDADDADDGSFFDGCQEPTNADELAGKIAIVDRGGCNFSVKVKFAQEAGAIATIIANIPSRDPDGMTPSPMGGDDDTVKIPNMGLSSTDGQAIYTAMDAGTVELSMFNDTPYRDGTLDNGTVAHEWGHYISNRLVGNASGLINNQGRSMGEGWGDFHALLLMVRAEDANIEGNDKFQLAYSGSGYTDNFYTGIRRAPYSTNMDINPLTFKHIEQGVELPEGISGGNNAEVHAAGEIWALALWEVYVALINDERHTFAQAQSLMMGYLVSGYKMTPIAPTFTEARDAILSIAYASDIADYKVMLAAFAKRGLGLGAKSPERNDDTHADVVESFKTELAIYSVIDTKLDTSYRTATMGYCSNDNILDNNETGTVSITIVNTGSELLTNIKAKIEIDSGHQVTFSNAGEIVFDTISPYAKATSTPIELTLTGAGTADELKFTITFPELKVNDDVIEMLSKSITATVNYDFDDVDPVSNSTFDDVETIAGRNNWQENVMVGGDIAKGTSYLDQAAAAYFTDQGIDTGTQMLGMTNNDFQSDVAMETREFEVGYNGDFTISWWHYFDLEKDWDGGVVEVSVNGGDWADAVVMGGTFANGYTGKLVKNEDQSLSERNTYTGFGSGTETLSFGEALNGNTVRFRFRLGSDAAAKEDGWFIDNIRFNNIATPIFSKVVAGDALACDNRPLVISSVTGESIPERVSAGGAFSTGKLVVVATDIDDDELSYSWTQISGPTASIDDADKAIAVFTSPLISENTTLTFEVTVSDGTVSVMKEVSVDITNNPAPVAPTKSSSGGALGMLSLLLVPFALLRRRKRF
ncbi:MAG: GlyGly-CTERM sorting domain-containing protein [Psychrobium sp.]|nr:GlyGly-CTERM sorting domain-containing protein [Psychrobium sp.]